MTLILIAVVAGMIAGISPCVLPVLPVVFVAGATTKAPSSWRRALSIVLGLVVSFSLLILAGAEIISLLHLPHSFLNRLGEVLLVVVGVSLLIPQVGHVLERPFVRLVAQRHPTLSSGGFVIGLALGLVFIPCAGPVLSTIIVLGNQEHVNLMTVFVTVAFSLGASVPLLFIALAGSALVARVRSLREHGSLLRRVGGVVLIVLAVAIATPVFNSLQKDVPSYTNSLQQHVEGSSAVAKELKALKGGQGSTDRTIANCYPGNDVLQQCGSAPNFTDVTKWLNTPDGTPLSMASLRGKVVLVDFWTYSCINCERSLPHVEAWYNRYKSYGLVVVGVHTPEFSFEYDVGNVKSAAKSLGVDYPIAVDDHYGTWNAYGNDAWPAEYLIDANGVVRHDDFGEGSYALTENLIRKLLVAAQPGLQLPPRTNVANRTPNLPTNPESYVGYAYGLPYLENSPAPSPDVTTNLKFPATLSEDYFALSGQWTVHKEEATARTNAKVELNYTAHDVYLVMGGTGTVQVDQGNGTPPFTLKIGGIPRLYTLFHSKSYAAGRLVLTVSPGVQAYDFTFG